MLSLSMAAILFISVAISPGQTAPSVEGGYNPAKNSQMAPVTEGISAALTYGDAGDADTGVAFVKFSPRELGNFKFWYSGFPDGQLLRYQLLNTNGVSFTIELPPSGNAWSFFSFEVPEPLRSEDVLFLAAVDESSDLQGWLGLGVGPAKPPRTVLGSLKAALATASALIAALVICGPAFLFARQAFTRVALGLIILGLWASAVFYAALLTAGPYFYNAMAWVAFAVGIVVWAAFLRRTMCSRCTACGGNLKESVTISFVAIVCFLLPVLVAGAHLNVGDPMGEAQNFYRGMPVDSHIPWILAMAAAGDSYTSPLFSDWLGSDRPPLQSGLILLLKPALWWTTAAWSAFATSCAAQALWVAGAFLLLRGAGFSLAATGMALVTASLSGVVLFNGLFTWPKLLSGGFLLASMGVLLRQLRGTGEQQPLPSSLVLVLCGALAGFALQCHGSAAFAIVPLGFFLLVYDKWKLVSPLAALRNVLVFAAPLVAIQIPWQLWQKFGDPPGDRLIKWHLGGVIPIDARGPLQTIMDSYGELSFQQFVANKIANLQAIFLSPDQVFSPWLSLFDQHLAIESDFYGPMAAITWAAPGLLLMTFALLGSRNYRRLFPAAWSSLAPILLWVLLTLVTWSLLMFIPSSTINHQGPMNLALVVLLLIGASLGHIAPTIWFVASIIQAAGVLWVYMGLRFEPSYDLQWVWFVVMPVIALIMTAAFASHSNRTSS
jgi:hypothetical protein